MRSRTAAILLTLAFCPAVAQFASPVADAYGGPSKWAIEQAERISREEVEAQKRREEEAAAKQQAETNQKHEKEEELEESRKQQEQETEQRESRGAPVACIVPALAGDSLAQARHVLRKAHCRLGSVSHRGGRGRRIPIVVGQRPRHGVHLKGGSAVTVTVTGHARRRTYPKRAGE